MRRIVVIASSMAGIRCATRIKRRLPQDEVNVIVPAALESMSSSGPAGRRMELPNLELLATRRVGIIEAHDIMPDLAQREVSVTSTRGSLPVRYSELIVEIPVLARQPRALQKAENVILMPVSGFTAAAAQCDAALARCAAEDKPVMVVGDGMDALAAVLLARESGAFVQWLCPKDRPAPWVEPHLAAIFLRELGPQVTLKRVDTPLEQLLLQMDDAGTTLTGIACPDGTTIEGGYCLWAASIMARHPLLREEGFTLDAHGRMIKDAEADPAVSIIGAGAALPGVSLARGATQAPVFAGGDETTAASSALTADSIAGNSADFSGLLGSWKVHMRCVADAPTDKNTNDLILCRAGLTMAEAETAGIAMEHATAAAPADMLAVQGGHPDGMLILTLLCHKDTGRVTGVQVMGKLVSQAAVDGFFGMGLLALEHSSGVRELAMREFPGLPGALLAHCASLLQNKLAGAIQGITPEELLASTEAGAEFFILDLRSQPEWKERRLPESYNIPFIQLKKRLQKEVPRNTPLVLVCASSNHAFNAACMLADLGATDLFVLDGGMDLWPYPL